MPENFLTPQAIISQLNLDKSMTAADFGCGSGGWTIPLAKILSEGKVFALDMLPGPLSALESRAKAEGILNIQAASSNVEEGITKLLAGSCDAVLMTNLLFECKDKKAVLKEAKRVLKSGGKILFVDWKKSASFGPRNRAVSPQDVKKLADEAGLKITEEFEAGPYHYGMVMVK